MAGSSIVDVCRYIPTAGGTTDWTFSAAVTGYQSPASAVVVNGALYSYRAESSDLSQWEVGQGAYNTGTGVLARTTVLFNSLGTTAKVNFTVAPQVGLVALAEDIQKIITTASNVLIADVAVNNISNYFDGPSMAQGTAGTWFASGTVTVIDTAAATSIFAKLWDGTTVISSTAVTTGGANFRESITLSGIIPSPAANIRISVNNPTLTTTVMKFNSSGNSKDCLIWGIRIA